jgi:hypothetical protein
MEVVLVLLAILWLLGYIKIPHLVVPRTPLFYINGHAINLWEVLIFVVAIWAIGITGSPFKEIFATLLILWVLATLGFITVVNFSNILVIAIIFGLVMAVVKKH